jgi:flagellar hook-associated protein 3 FlgL
MRITNAMLQQQSVSDIANTLSAMADVQRQLSSGQRLDQLSDDPAAAAQILRVEHNLRAVAQYQRNITAARTNLTTQESALSQITDLLSRAQQIATQEASGTATGATRTDAAQEVDQLAQQVIALGNTQIGDAYVFGGTQTTTAPFQADGTYVGDDTAPQTVIGAGEVVQSGDTGRVLFTQSGVISSLQALSTALKSGDATQVQGTISGLGDAFAATQSNLAATGAHQNYLQVATQNLQSLQANLTQQRSDVADVQVAEATMQFLGLQNTLQAALLATARLAQTSLTQYLR